MDSKSKWNHKYRERLEDGGKPPANVRLQGLSAYFNGGVALDFACGLGANSLYLAEKGYRVQALDISEVAINYLKEQAAEKKLDILPKVVDLTAWTSLNITESSFDLVTITYYLDRSIFPFIKSIVKENGYFFMETYYLTPEKKKENISDQYKLRSQELIAEFRDWQVLYFEENEQEGRQTILVRKSAS